MKDYFNETQEVAEYWNGYMCNNVIEEAAELQLAIQKYKRLVSFDILRSDFSMDKRMKLFDNVKDEMADMFISLWAFMHECDIDPEDMEGRIEKKLEKRYE